MKSKIAWDDLSLPVKIQATLVLLAGSTQGGNFPSSYRPSLYRGRNLGIFSSPRACIEGRSSEFFQVPRTFPRMWRHQEEGGLGNFQIRSGIQGLEDTKHGKIWSPFSPLDVRVTRNVFKKFLLKTQGENLKIFVCKTHPSSQWCLSQNHFLLDVYVYSYWLACVNHSARPDISPTLFRAPRSRPRLKSRPN